MSDLKPKRSQRRRARNFLIHPRAQLRYAALAVISGLVLSAAHTAVFYLFVRENYDTLVELAPIHSAVRLQLHRELFQIISYLSLTSIGFILLTAAIAIIVSHRAAGPLYHFKRVFDEVRKGKLKTRIQLRPGDDFQDVAESFNLMLDRLERMKQVGIPAVDKAKDRHAA